MQPLIDSTRVTAVFMDCLFKEDEIVDGKPPSEAVIVDGIISKVGFHPGRLAGYKGEITEILNRLPVGFHKATGGGWSFLNMCNDRNDVQWTGFHKVMGELVAIGIGLGLVSYLMPRDLWDSLPGGMPYLVVDCENSTT